MIRCNCGNPADFRGVERYYCMNCIFDTDDTGVTILDEPGVDPAPIRPEGDSPLPDFVPEDGKDKQSHLFEGG